MRTILASLLITAVASFGCGGKSKSEMTDPCKDMPMDGEHHEDGMGEGEGEHHEGGEEHEMTPEMTAFHDTLAPLWHADAGPQRVTDTCDASGKMLNLGADLQNGAVPEGVDATVWSTAVYRLNTAVMALQDVCPAQPGAAFDDAFTEVHESFHGLLEVLPKG